MKPSLQLRVGQQLTLTPQLKQAIRLLTLSTLELQTELAQAIETNPMLEWDDAAPADEYAQSTESTDSAESPSSEVSDNDAQSGEPSTEEDWREAADFDLPIWHLPAEKTGGIVLIFNSIKRGVNAWSLQELGGWSGIPHRTKYLNLKHFLKYSWLYKWLKDLQ